MAKKLLSFVATALCYVAAQAQTTIPNPDFEDWKTTIKAPSIYNDPIAWDIEDCIATGSSSFDCEKYVDKSRDPQSGEFAIELVNTIDTTGRVFLSSSSNIVGVPFTGKPSAMTFYVKSELLGDDFFQASISFFDTNGTDTLNFTGASKTIYQSYANYKLVELSISDYQSREPEFIQIKFELGSDTDYDRNSYALIDNIQFDYTPVGLEDRETEALELFPNPAGDKIYLKEFSDYTVYSITGAAEFSGEADQIDVSQLKTGTYFIQTVTSSGELRTNRIIKE